MQNHIQKNHSTASAFAYPPSAHGIDNKSKNDLKNLRKIRNTNHGSACLFSKPSFVLRAKLTLNLKLSPEKKLLGQGIGGEVWMDKNDNSYVIKCFRSIGDTLTTAQHECDMFNRFYGEESAELFIESDKIHIRMRRVPGRSLASLPRENYPENGKELFLNMIIEMNDRKIIHSDLHFGNILYDTESNRFWPIDISNSYHSYYRLDTIQKEFLNKNSDKEFSMLLKELTQT